MSNQSRQELLEFQEVFKSYAESFGHTFTSFCLFPSNDAFGAALEQMQQCLSGDRTEPVTNESIGQTGEGVQRVEDVGFAEKLGCGSASPNIFQDTESLDFYDPRQPRDARGRFGSGKSALKTLLNSPQIDLVEQYRQEFRLQLESIESKDLNDIILSGGQSYGDILNSQGKVAADQKLDQTIDNLATYKARNIPPAQQKKTKVQQRIEDQALRGKASFDKAPDILKRAVEKHGHPPILRPESKEGAYFLEGNGIHMDSKPKEYYEGVYRHEWGHYVDYKLGNNSYLSSSEKGKKAFARDEKAFDKDLYEGILSSVFKAASISGDKDSGSGWVADIAAAITKNKVGHGHSDEYFAWDENRRTETFANIVSLVGSGNPVLAEAAQALAPNMYKLAMDKLS